MDNVPYTSSINSGSCEQIYNQSIQTAVRDSKMGSQIFGKYFRLSLIFQKIGFGIKGRALNGLAMKWIYLYPSNSPTDMLTNIQFENEDIRRIKKFYISQLLNPRIKSSKQLFTQLLIHLIVDSKFYNILESIRMENGKLGTMKTIPTIGSLGFLIYKIN